MTKLYTFNRPLVALWLLPLALLTVMLLYGIMQEFNVIVIVMSLVSFLFLVPIIYLAFLRRLKVGEEQAEWITPKVRHTMPYTEVKHFGIVKYRSFRFIFLARTEEEPFTDPSKPIVPGADIFLIQFRPAAWKHLKDLVQRHREGLQPLDLKRN